MDLKNDKLKRYLCRGHFGLEKEALRIDGDGRTALSRHPFGDEPHLTRDFCENQLEIITDVCDTIDDLMADLTAKHVAAAKVLAAKGEYLWPFSNPPLYGDEDDIPIATFGPDMQEKNEYRRYLAKKYGKKLMLYSGVHFNFSFPEGFLRAAFGDSGESDYRSFKDGVYLDLAQKITATAWFLVYLTAASSVADPSFLAPEVIAGYASPRCGDIGYWNDFTPTFQYGSLAAYVESIEGYVAAGKLVSAAELYYPVRVKPRGANEPSNLLKNGVDHIELRMLDVQPFAATGVDGDDIRFITLFLYYLVFRESVALSKEDQLRAIANMKAAATFSGGEIVGADGAKEPAAVAAAALLTEMADFYADFGRTDATAALIAAQRKKISDESQRLAVRVREDFEDDYIAKGAALARRYARDAFLIPAREI